MTFKRALSKKVPVPMTRSRGKPEIFCVNVVKISTGLAETTKIPLKPLSTIGSTIERKILTFLLTRSIRVSPGRRGTPAVMTTIAASAAS